MTRSWALALLVAMACASPRAEPMDPHLAVRGMTVSTPTAGREWGTAAMGDTLDVLGVHGVNWVATHPYAGIDKDGSVRPFSDPERAPPSLVRPIADAHARGMKILIKPHLAHWGSGFSWRGDIAFDDEPARQRFFEQYTAWIVAVATACSQADAFAVGTELDGTAMYEAQWREVIAAVRAVYGGQLVFASNWDRYADVPFWDALDAIGIQAYFPLLDEGEPLGIAPDAAALRARWSAIFADIGAVTAATGKPVVFTELGYDAGPHALHRPWESGTGHADLQRLALRVALEEIRDSDAVRGAFLWKWFPSELQRGDFRMSQPELRAVLDDVWAR